MYVDSGFSLRSRECHTASRLEDQICLPKSVRPHATSPGWGPSPSSSRLSPSPSPSASPLGHHPQAASPPPSQRRPQAHAGNDTNLWQLGHSVAAEQLPLLGLTGLLCPPQLIWCHQTLAITMAFPDVLWIRPAQRCLCYQPLIPLALCLSGFYCARS